MSNGRKPKVRLHPTLCALANDLRSNVHYHAPGGAMPTRGAVIDLSLRKGLRKLEWLLLQNRYHEPMLPYVLVRDYNKVTIAHELLEFADRMRGPFHEARRSLVTTADHPRFPSRCRLLVTALDLGLMEVQTLYAMPTIAITTPLFRPTHAQ